MRDKGLTGVPAFRRSWWGYNTRDVDLFLKETAADRHRLKDDLTRMETLMAEWQCGPDAIPAAAHGEPAEIRAKAERDARSASKPAGGRLQVISLNVSRRELPATSEASLPALRNGGGFLSEGFITDNAGLLPDEVSVTRTPVTAIEALERSRSHRRRRTRRIGGLVAACASVLAIIAFEFSDQGSKVSYGEVNAEAAAGITPARDQTATKTPTPSGSTAVTAVQNSTGAPAPSVAPAKSLMLTISAVKPCWIRTVVDGTQQMERILRPDETVVLHATNEVLLRVGDAEAVSLLINNQPAKPLGRSGEVVTRLITRANYSSLLRIEF